jgi:hypothetical protein
MLAQGSSFGSYCSFVDFSQDVVSAPYLLYTCILGSHTDLSCKLGAITIEKKGSDPQLIMASSQNKFGRVRMYIFFARLITGLVLTLLSSIMSVRKV